MSNLDMGEALAALAQDKGISVDTLLGALADALESAYKRMPEAHEYAWVTIDPDTFDMRVFAQEIDEDGEPYGPELDVRSEEHTSELQSLMRISYAVFCLKKKKQKN